MKKGLVEIFADCVDEWRFFTRLRPETIRGYEAVFNLFLRTMPEVVRVDDLTAEMLNEYFKRIETRKRIVGRNTLKSGVKKTTIKTHWSKLNVFFKWLQQKGYLDENPLNGIKPPRVRYDDFKRLEGNEINKIYSSIVIYPNSPLIISRDTAIVSLLLYLGIRKGELMSLMVKDVDLIKKQITIRGETSKSGKTRILPIGPTLRMHLEDYFKERRRLGLKTEYLIVSSRGDRGLSRDGIKHWVNSLIKKSGVKFHLHQFRHTFACILTEKGVPSLSLQKLMGHTSMAMTSKYTRSLKAEDMYQDICKITF